MVLTRSSKRSNDDKEPRNDDGMEPSNDDGLRKGDESSASKSKSKSTSNHSIDFSEFAYRKNDEDNVTSDNYIIPNKSSSYSLDMDQCSKFSTPPHHTTTITTNTPPFQTMNTDIQKENNHKNKIKNKNNTNTSRKRTRNNINNKTTTTTQKENQEGKIMGKKKKMPQPQPQQQPNVIKSSPSSSGVEMIPTPRVRRQITPSPVTNTTITGTNDDKAYMVTKPIMTRRKQSTRSKKKPQSKEQEQEQDIPPDSIISSSTTNPTTPSRSPSMNKKQTIPTTPNTKRTSTAKAKATATATATPSKRTPTKKSTPKTTPSPRRRTPRIEPGSLPPPKDWQSIYTLVKELRADRTAPVESDGCEALPETHRGDKIYRLQVLISLMLSSQTKDAIVGETIRILQSHGLDIPTLLATPYDTLNQRIYKVGFHNNKAKYILQTVKLLHEQYDDDIPHTAQDIMSLPGVGPKMAYIVENVAWNKSTGIGVDTHMHRMFNDLKWVQAKTPEDTREQLEGWLPRDLWMEVNVLWVGFGQEIQQQKEKALQKALTCSRPKDALKLYNTLGMNVAKEAKRYGLQQQVLDVITTTKENNNEK